jgi:periplasmic protein TonB
LTTAVDTLVAPKRLVRRRADRADGRLSRDRLITMVVLAALLHGLIILGVSFTSTGSKEGGADRGLEVLLVSDELPEALRNDSATYLSQRTQMGSGNTKERQSAKLPAEARAKNSGAAADTTAPESASDPVLASSRNGQWSTVQILTVPATLAEQAAAVMESQRRGDDELVLRGETRDELYITADTRATRLAPYLDAWRRRVERIGTVNYPSIAQRQAISRNPVIEVTLQRDGKLRAARIQRSSGRPEMDAAALNILRLASPFEPFPPDLSRDYRSLRFAYEWQFVEGKTGASGTLTVP